MHAWLKTLSLGAAGAALTLSAACSGSSDSGGAPGAAPPPPPPAPAAAAAPASANAAAEADTIFAQRCTPCHGAEGAGDGAASAGLNPKPRNLSEAAWQDSVTDEHIDKIIQYGGAAVGKSPAMPANPDLGSKPDVIAALRVKIRNLKK